jgi:catechol 2,3-dioxygenase-like lactoylglutathione lyase family enzyme
MAQTIAIERIDHIGIRVRDLDRALAFYRVLGFTLAHRKGRGHFFVWSCAPGNVRALRDVWKIQKPGSKPMGVIDAFG